MTDPQARPLRRTPLTGVHERMGATMTGFAGWQMPLRYNSETAEHNAVRTAAGLFDLSHMGEIAVAGAGAAAALDYALVGQPSALAPGRARYTMICAPDGGILDDLIVYRLAEDEFLVVANAANTEIVFRELTGRAGESGLGSLRAQVTDLTDDYALIALQGPHAARVLAPITDADLTAVKYYASYPATVAGRRLVLARTGYTGEDGFELFARPEDAGAIWEALSAAGAADGLVPAGLAARDTLRLEAGMPLYGNELGPEVTPYDAGLGRVVKLGKPGDFVGRAALAKRAEAEPERQLVGLVGQTRRVPRHGYKVLWDGIPCGTVTSGAPSPTLGRPIAMAYVEADVARQARQDEEEGKPSRLAVDVRGSAEPAVLVPLPFYHRPA
ncbi:MAG TPA: glycine cleavage system aminomethyltransferase GcvT [Streptosporangiaceae bacterium]|jgi:aminomethyltransferase|nr:glycine cleavage system aminomethyltransferase GcvT [Streptosporangiaceae bacterium]